MIENEENTYIVKLGSYFPPVRSAYSQGRDAKYSSGSPSHNYVHHTVNGESTFLD